MVSKVFAFHVAIECGFFYFIKEKSFFYFFMFDPYFLMVIFSKMCFCLFICFNCIFSTKNKNLRKRFWKRLSSWIFFFLWMKTWRRNSSQFHSPIRNKSVLGSTEFAFCLNVMSLFIMREAGLSKNLNPKVNLEILTSYD